MTIDAKVAAFCERFGLDIPVMLAPMAGVSATGLSAAVMSAGGMGALGALLMSPPEIAQWAATVRRAAAGPFQLNLWVPDPAPIRDAEAEARVRAFLRAWGPEVPSSAGDAVPPDFASQCDALLEAAPAAVSSVMGVFPPDMIARAKAQGTP